MIFLPDSGQAAWNDSGHPDPAWQLYPGQGGMR